MRVIYKPTGQLGDIPNDKFDPSLFATPEAQVSQQVVQQPQANPYTQGALGFLVNQAPTIGAIGGGVVGAPLEALNAVIPGAGLAANIALSGAGANLGERIKENLQKSGQLSLQAQNPEEIQKQTLLGASGPVLGKILGVGAKVASKIPGVGGVVEGIGNIGNAAWEKLFGTGDLASVEGGAKALTQLAKNKGIANAGGLSEMGQKTAQELASTGQKLGDTLSSAASKGVGIKSGMMDQIIDNAGPKITDNPQALADLKNSAKIAYQKMIGPNLDINTGEALFPVDAMNVFKQQTAQLAKFGSDNPGLVEQFNRDLSMAMKNRIEDLVPQAKGLNQEWWNLHQIGDHLQNISQNQSLNPLSLKNANMLKSVGQTADLTKQVIPQLGIRFGQPNTFAGLNIGQPGQQQDGLQSMRNNPQFSRENLLRAYYQEITNNPYSPRAGEINTLINQLYPKNIFQMLLGGIQNQLPAPVQ